jgi:phage baseplate assembly protein W
MPVGLSPRFPLSISENGDFATNQNIKELVKQNFKNLLLTIPGERIMLPDFGVGAKKFLFETRGAGKLENIIGIIQSQVSVYMPYIDIVNVTLNDNMESDQIISIKIEYYIKPLSEQDIISITAI